MDMMFTCIVSVYLSNCDLIVRFGGGKEDFMVCMNEFVQMEAANVKTFFDQISVRIFEKFL